jgi:hypothetical protein
MDPGREEKVARRTSQGCESLRETVVRPELEKGTSSDL